MNTEIWLKINSIKENIQFTRDHARGMGDDAHTLTHVRNNVENIKRNIKTLKDLLHELSPLHEEVNKLNPTYDNSPLTITFINRKINDIRILEDEYERALNSMGTKNTIDVAYMEYHIDQCKRDLHERLDLAQTLPEHSTEFKRECHDLKFEINNIYRND